MNNTSVRTVRLAPLSLTTLLPNGDKVDLTWSIRNGFPRVTVFLPEKPGMDVSKYDNMITAPFDIVSLYMFFTSFKRYILSEGSDEVAVKCYNVKYVDDVRTDEIYEQGVVTIKRTDAGTITISVSTEGKDVYDFELKPSNKWFSFTANGDEINDVRELSNMYALVYIELLEKLLAKYIILDDRAITTRPFKVPQSKKTPPALLTDDLVL